MVRRVNISLSEIAHERLFLLKHLLKKANIDSTIEALINRVYEELAKK